MELFRLLGRIAIDNTEANSAIDETTDKASSFSENLSDKFTSFGEKATSLGTKLSVGLTTPIMLIGGKAIQATSDFEYAMSEVAAISGATGDDFAALTDKAKEMGEKTKFSASESAEALKYMAMAGWKTNDMLDGLEGIMNLAAAAGEDLGTTSDIVTDALTAFGLSAEDSGHFADVLAAASSNANTNVSMMGDTFKYVAPVAGALGYSAEDVALAIGLMANSGIKASQAGTSLRSMLTRLAKPTDEVLVAMNALDLSITNSDGTMKSFNEVIDDLRTGFAGLTEEEKAQTAARLAGQEGMSGLLAIVNAGESDFNKLSDAINNCDGVTQQMADTMNDNLAGQVTLLKSQLEGLAIQFVTLIMPYLRQGVDWLSKICDWISGLDDGTKKLIIVIAGLLAAAGPVLIFAGKVSTGIGGIIKVGSTLAGGIGKVAPLLSGLSGNLGGLSGILGAVKGGFASLGGALGAIASPVGIVIAAIAALVGVFVYLWNTNEEFRTSMTNTWNEIVATCSPLLEELKAALTDLWENVLKPFIDFIATSLAPVFQIAFQLIGEQFSAFLTVLTGVIEFITGIFSGDWQKAWSGIEKIFSGIWQGIQSLAKSAMNLIQNVVQTGLELVKSYFQSKLNAALNIVNGILDKIKNKFNNTMDNAKNIVNKGIELIKKAFNFTWKLPPLKVPHFNISGGFSLNPPSVPSFSIEWYKKGAILTEPTAFGLNPFSGKTMVGGEAGNEAIAPVDLLLGYIRQAVAEQNSTMVTILTKILEKLDEFKPNGDGDIIIPIYFGNELWDEIIINSKNNVTLRSGGMVNA